MAMIYYTGPQNKAWKIVVFDTSTKVSILVWVLGVESSFARVLNNIFRYGMRKMRFYAFYNFLKSLLRTLHRKISFDTRAKDDSTLVLESRLSHLYRNILLLYRRRKRSFTHWIEKYTHSNDATACFTHIKYKKIYIIRHAGEIFTTSWSSNTRCVKFNFTA